MSLEETEKKLKYAEQERSAKVPQPQAMVGVQEVAAFDTKRHLIFRIEHEVDDLLRKATALRELRSRIEQESIFSSNIAYEVLMLLGR
jgi:hypothetical protein